MKISRLLRAAAILVLCAFAATAAGQAHEARWELRIQDLKGELRATAVLRFADSRANSCVFGSWKQVVVDGSSKRDDRFFPMSEPLAYDVRDGQVTIVRTQVCDRYGVLKGALRGDTVEGDYASVTPGSSTTLGRFTLRRIADIPPIPQEPDRYDVILLPTEDFSYDCAAALATSIANNTHLKVRAVLNLGTAAWTPDGDQYDPAKLVEIARPAIAKLRNVYGGTLYIVLTTRDTNFADRTLRFTFAASYPNDMVSVISSARLLPEGTSAPDWGQRIGVRLYEMTLRSIAPMYFKLPRTADPADLMFSPLMTVDDLDRLEPRLHRPADRNAPDDQATH